MGILSAFALRLFHLGQESLWYDETVSVVLARKSISSLIAHTAGDIHPPGYYLLLHGWQQLTGPTVAHGLEFLFAWPSLFFGMLMVVLIYPLGRRLFSPTVAWVALWLAAIHPYQIWYSQEVRMYTVGATLGLLALWALLQLLPQVNHPQAGHTMGTRRRPLRWLALYTLACAAGLYTLYYFLFLLLALNLLALLILLPPLLTRQPRPPHGRQLLVQWLGAQVAVLLLWLPWLPIFWRQAVNPPVPPWRMPWDSATTFLAALSESVSALLVGQSAPAPQHPVWLLLGLFLLVAATFSYTKTNASRQRIHLLVPLLYTLLPLGLLYVLSVTVTPLYHVRYLILYAPPLLLSIAAGIVTLYQQRRWWVLPLLLSVMLLNGLSLHRFWYDPQFQSDDHREAVADLARRWRPGDTILVNAGWVYTTLETYWPTELTGPLAARPATLSPPIRLVDYIAARESEMSESLPTATSSVQPQLIRGGTVDGASSLGWGNPASDFFAISTAATTEALTAIAADSHRIWHYRLYDTVSDEASAIRAWLHANGTQLLDQPYPGRDFLRLQLYATAAPAASPRTDTTTQETQSEVTTPATLQLVEKTLLPTEPKAGTTLYAQTFWQHQPEAAAIPTDLRTSLRLYNADGQLVAQQDETPLLPPFVWSTATLTQSVLLPLALPVAVATPPGTYTVRLVLYDGTTGSPIPIAATGDPTTPELSLGEVTVSRSLETPTIRAQLVRFDYIALLQAAMWTEPIAEGVKLRADLIWLPRPSSYRDTYVGRWSLRDESGTLWQQWEVPLGGWEYPSGRWPAQIPVQQQLTLERTEQLPLGIYTVDLAVYRQADGVIIPATRSWWRSTPDYRMGVIQVAE